MVARAGSRRPWRARPAASTLARQIIRHRSSCGKDGSGSRFGCASIKAARSGRSRRASALNAACVLSLGFDLDLAITRRPGEAVSRCRAAPSRRQSRRPRCPAWSRRRLVAGLRSAAPSSPSYARAWLAAPARSRRLRAARAITPRRRSCGRAPSIPANGACPVKALAGVLRPHRRRCRSS